MSEPTPHDILLAAWKCEQPSAALRGDLDRWAEKWRSSPGLWPSIALRALRYQQLGLSKDQLELEVRLACEAERERTAEFIASITARGVRVRAAGAQANAQLTQQLLDEL